MNVLRLLLLALLAVSNIMVSLGQNTLEEGLIAYYPFCNDFDDYSASENLSILTDMQLSEDRRGSRNQAALFNGSTSYIDCGNQNVLNQIEESFSVSVWIKQLPGGGSQQAILSKWNNNQSTDHFTLLVNGKRLLLAIGNPDYSSPGINTQFTIEEERWYHVVALWNNSGRHQIFVDGENVLDRVSMQFDRITQTSPVHMHIGRQVDPVQHNRAFNGLIDEVRLYNRELSIEEIEELGMDIHILPQDTIIICDEENITLTPNILTADEYVWDDGSTSISREVMKNGIYWVNIMNGNCLMSDTVIVKEFQMKGILDSLVSICSDSTLIVDITNLDEQYTYAWQDGSQSPLYEISKEGVYVLEINGVQCTHRVTMRVQLVNCSVNCQTYIPTGFSPNHDGLNDFFIPLSDCPMSSISMTIFDRWGGILYAEEDTTTGWNGYEDNQLLPPGTYVYLLDISYQGGGTDRLSGNVMLVR